MLQQNTHSPTEVRKHAVPWLSQMVVNVCEWSPCLLLWLHTTPLTNEQTCFRLTTNHPKPSNMHQKRSQNGQNAAKNAAKNDPKTTKDLGKCMNVPRSALKKLRSLEGPRAVHPWEASELWPKGVRWKNGRLNCRRWRGTRGFLVCCIGFSSILCFFFKDLLTRKWGASSLLFETFGKFGFELAAQLSKAKWTETAFAHFPQIA